MRVRCVESGALLCGLFLSKTHDPSGDIRLALFPRVIYFNTASASATTANKERLTTGLFLTKRIQRCKPTTTPDGEVLVVRKNAYKSLTS
jgi:hypothetical protein